MNAILEPGEGGDPVIVEGAYDMMQTQTAAVQQTMVVGDIEQYPLRTHNALDLATMLSATLTTGSGSSGTIINGLPNVTMNITLDGVNVQDNHARNGNGFGAPIRPTLESIEQIGVLSAAPGAERTGQGAVQIQMVTRAGSNRFSGSVYNSWRNQAGTTDEDVLTRSQKPGWLWRLNTPYWFNKRDRPKTPAGEYFIDDVRLTDARLPRRRPRRDSARVRRPRQGVLLLQLGVVPLAEPDCPEPLPPQHFGAAGHLHLPRG